MTQEIITHPQLVAALAKPGEKISEELTPNDAHVLHMVVGLVGEVSELIDAKNRENVVEELGDLEFYLEGLRTGLGISLEDCKSSTYTESIVDFNKNMVVTSGHILDWVKRLVIYRKPPAIENLVWHLTCLEGMLNDFRIHLNISREETLDHNIHKLSDRYKSLCYSDQAAQERADKSE